jgi:formate hydrogenlyase subunit 3/multisubunit Na+/H+ antiporter MnhD subunit
MSKLKIPSILVFPITIAIIVGFCVLVGFVAKWLGAYNPNGWGFFTGIVILGGSILFIGFRQLYWLFTGKGDYEGKGLPALWRRIFKK